MGYKNKLVRIDCSDLGEGCFVEMRNPRLVSTDELDPGFDVEVVDGRPVNPEKAEEAGRIAMSRLITDWCVWALDDDSDDPAVLPLPKDDAEVWGRVPVDIIGRIGKEIADSRPQ